MPVGVPRETKLGQAMESYRYAKGLSMAAAAEMLKPRRVTLGTWANWELGRNPPSSKHRVCLEKLLDITIAPPKKGGCDDTIPEN